MPGSYQMKNTKYDLAMHDDRIRAHYAHAIEKHPYFCDKVFSDRRSSVDPVVRLRVCRNLLKTCIKESDVDFLDVADCELAEAYEAFCNGDKAQAVEELYDMIAVCLRTIDVLEGRQALGKSETPCRS